MSKILTSINCATINAVPEPIAILIEIKSEKKPEEVQEELTNDNSLQATEKKSEEVIKNVASKKEEKETNKIKEKNTTSNKEKK